MAFKKALIERALGGELSHHLGYPLGAAKPDESSNHRNGATGKTILTDDGPLRLEIPRQLGAGRWRVRLGWTARGGVQAAASAARHPCAPTG